MELAGPAIRSDLSQSEFLDHLRANLPVLVRGALKTWAHRPPWDVDSLVGRVGHLRASVFGSMFELRGLTTLARFVTDHAAVEDAREAPYIRWFSRQGPERYPWADCAFDAIKDDWHVPSWFPKDSFVYPHSASTLDPRVDGFPARGIFVCGPGGRTRLHVDPWVSDAILCQATGRKHIRLFPPEAVISFVAGGEVVDLDAPDLTTFPCCGDPCPALDTVLEPGDALLIPAGWFHTVVALDFSVSLTWNFVHATTRERFDDYLENGGAEDPTVRFFACDAEGAGPGPGAKSRLDPGGGGRGGKSRRGDSIPWNDGADDRVQQEAPGNEAVPFGAA